MAKDRSFAAIRADAEPRAWPDGAIVRSIRYSTFIVTQDRLSQMEQTMRPKSLAAFLAPALALLIALPSPAWAWGRLGHRVISKLAERNLSDRAKAEIKALLEPGESLADCSTWADEVRNRMRYTAPWHYVDVPLDEPRYDDKWAADDSRKGFVVPKIRELKAILKDPSKSVEDRRFALRFLVHLVEDLHMPMHVGENHGKGGNQLQVRFFDLGSNLHSVWDTGIITRAEKDEGRWVDILAAMDTPEARQKAQGGTVEDSATESLLASREAYQDPATGQRMKPGTKLADAYQAKSLPVAKERLYRASTASEGAQRGVPGEVTPPETSSDSASEHRGRADGGVRGRDLIRGSPLGTGARGGMIVPTDTSNWSAPMIIALVIAVAIGQNPPAEVARSIQRLTSQDRLERHAACEALMKARSLPEAAADPIISYLKLEVEQAMVLPKMDDPRRDRGANKVPTVGDEASIAGIEANPQGYVGRSFILVGGARHPIITRVVFAMIRISITLSASGARPRRRILHKD